MRPPTQRDLTERLEELAAAIHEDCTDDIALVRACIYELRSLRRANAELMVELHMRELEDQAELGDGVWIN